MEKEWSLMNYHSIWYFALVAASMLLLLYTYYQKRNHPVLLLLIAAIGFGYIIEGIIYNLLHSYEYYPHLLPNNPTYDSNLGAIASNVFVLPVVAVFVATFQKGWKWILFLSLLIIGIEGGFLKLGIYKHNWWRIEFTFFGLLTVYFPMIKLFNRWLQGKQSGVRHYLLLFLIISPILGTFHILPIMFFTIRSYHLGWYENVYQDTNAFAAIYYICSGLFITTLARLKWLNKWTKCMILIIVLFLISRLLISLGILNIFVWWDPYYYALFPVLILIFSGVISRKIGEVK
jgi:hypothetical protein